METIFDRIEKLMKEQGIANVRQLAIKAGISYQTLYHVFQRRSDIKEGMLTKLKNALNTSLEYLVAGTDANIEKELIGHNPASSVDMDQLNQIIKEMDARGITPERFAKLTKEQTTNLFNIIEIFLNSI